MADIARKDRHPVLVGDVVVSVAGNVVPLEPGAPDPASAPRLTLADVGEHVIAEIKIPAPYIAAKFVDAAFSTYRPDPAAPAQAAALEAVKMFCRLVHNGNAPMLALIGSTGTGKSHLLYSAAKALHA